MKKWTRELLLWILIVLPYVYLASIWQELPDKVPTHFNTQGDPDGWSGKSLLLLIPAALGAGIYLVMLLGPVLDPKKKIGEMGDKYFRLRLLLTVFMSALALYMLYVTKAGRIENPQWLLVLIGLLVAMLGNYFQALRPNYFLGIRTPWTLESEEVWKKTHYLGGRLWMAGGLLIVVLALLIKHRQPLLVAVIAIFFLIVLIPVVFSYVAFKRKVAS